MQGARPSTEYTPHVGMPPGLLEDADALTLILKQLRVENQLTTSLLRLQNFRAVNKYARAHIVVHHAVLVHALLGVDMGMSPLALATMIRQMSPMHRDHLVHLAEQWNTPHAIKDSYFLQCQALAIRKLSPLLTLIGNSAFYQCPSLNVVEWDAPRLTDVDAYAFADCTSLTLETWHAPILTFVGRGVFTSCTALVLSTWHSTALTTIRMRTFKGCVSLTLKEWHAPLLTFIDEDAFQDCSALVWENGCPFPLNINIEDGAFRGCTKLSAKAKDQIQAINASALDPV